MTGSQFILGCDTGPTPGLVGLLCVGGAVLAVTTWDDVNQALQDVASFPEAPWVAVERFIIARGTTKKGRGPALVTITMAQNVRDYAKAQGWPLQMLPAGSVKPRMKDAHLKGYGVWDHVAGPHQRDAARHALYMAVNHGVLPAVAPS